MQDQSHGGLFETERKKVEQREGNAIEARGGRTRQRKENEIKWTQ